MSFGIGVKHRIFKPIQTKYRDVLFKSKSEAIFARMLDNLGLYEWQYEPWWADAEDGYFPDFYVSMGFVDTFIEYKPRETTDAYKDVLLKRAHELITKRAWHPVCFYLVEMNPFDLEECNSVYYPVFPPGHDDDEKRWVIKNGFEWQDAITEAKSYRYDLIEHI